LASLSRGDLVALAFAPLTVDRARLMTGGAPHIVARHALDSPTIFDLAGLVAGTAFFVILASLDRGWGGLGFGASLHS